MKHPPVSLPQRYLADLPEQAELTPGLVEEAWFALLRNQEQHLTTRTTESIIQVLAEAANSWLNPDSPFMRIALQLGPSQLGFSESTLEEGLQLVFSTVTTEQLELWIEQDLGHPKRLDEFCASVPERVSHRRSKAVGPESMAHLTAGNIPASAVMSMTAGLLVRSAQFVKCATGTSLIPRLFAHSIHQIDPQLGACLEVADWSRKRTELMEALFAPAECITATGSNETLAAIRGLVPVTKRFVGYGHKLSFIFLTKESLEGRVLAETLDEVVQDICHWNQLGCLSPHVVYVESGGAIRPDEFAARLSEALDKHEQRRPRGGIPDTDSATIRSRRAFYEIRAANSPETRLWQSRGSTAWTVVFESDPLFQASCLNRFIYVKQAVNLDEVLHAADQVRYKVSTVALPETALRQLKIPNQLAAWGVHRICPIGSMQAPPPLWRHDGRPALGELVQWTDLEDV